MKLREVALPFRYTVLAVCDASGNCQVEAALRGALEDGYDKAVANISASIREWTPQHGPPFDMDGERAKRLRDGVCEYRASQRRKAKGLRVFFFQEGTSVILTSAILKSPPTPNERIEEAIRYRREYLNCLKTGDVEILRGWGA